MIARRLSDASLAALSGALDDCGAVNRWQEKVVAVEGSGCWWWVGAISGRGHGRFYFEPRRVIIAHRFAFGLVHGAQTLDQVRVLGHRCDNPLVSGSTLSTWCPPRMRRTGASGRRGGS